MIVSKLLILAAVVGGFMLIFYPRLIPRLLGGLGRAFGGAGRAGFELVTGEELENSPLARYEVKAGAVLAKKLLLEYPAAGDAALDERVQRIGADLARSASRREIPYRFTVVEGTSPNAFAVAGGSVFVTRNLLELCGQDDGTLACVLGHEVVHIDRRHAIANLAASAAVRGGIRLISLGRQAILARVVSGMEQLVVKGYRQEQELEADRVGCHLASQAGYDPTGLIALLARLDAERPAASGPIARVRGYFSSHPPTPTRIAALRQHFGASGSPPGR